MGMRWRRAARRGSKWACTGAAAACVVGFALSLFWWATWITPSGRRGVGIQEGALGGMWLNPPRGLPLSRMGFHLERQSDESRMMCWWPGIGNGPRGGFAALPLWIPFLLTAI